MLVVISPAKTLDFETPPATADYSLPGFLDESERLVQALQTLSPEELSGLMGISSKLALLNHRRFAEWTLPFSPETARPAVLAFKGDVYEGLAADTFSAADFQTAQARLRILSGLYGLLRPLDLIRPYRLEMGTPLATERGATLYRFWGDRITEALNAALEACSGKTLVNLASNEYFKAVNVKRLAAGVVTPVFKDYKNGTYKVISFYAKKARGMMSRFAIQQRISDARGLKAFTEGGYAFNPALSSRDQWVFTRKPA
ncbi:peroxide stress protein YaaA [Desulfococcus sp.]|uniref:peroxide stress protein YaaA n=1 Tax=Desulfococcus sp. TaxID=2025834 RepID=UPI0035944A0B